MELSRRGQTDERRRRLFMDDTTAESSGAVSTSTLPPARSLGLEDQPNKNCETEDMDGLPSIAALIPKRTWVFALWFMLGVAAIALVEGLYWWMPQVAKYTTDGTVEAFDLDGEGSLSVWFSSFWLTLSGFAALLIYTVRSQRVDDYHGRYRLWLWAALCWFTMSLDETASLHEGFKEMMTFLTGSRLMGDGSLWWVGAYGIVLINLSFMLWMEMRGCWSSRISYAMMAVCFAVAVVAQLEVVPNVPVRVSIMVEEGAEMLGDICLLLSMALHARFVIGQSKATKEEPAKKTKRTTKSTSTTKTSTTKRKTAAASKTGSTRRKTRDTGTEPEVEQDAPEENAEEPAVEEETPEPVSSHYSSYEPEPEPEPEVTQHNRYDEPQVGHSPHRKLSKSERRAMKRQQRMG